MDIVLVLIIVFFFYIGYRIYLRCNVSTVCFGTPVEELFGRKRGWLFKMEDNLESFAILYSGFFPTHLTNSCITYGISRELYIEALFASDNVMFT